MAGPKAPPAGPEYCRTRAQEILARDIQATPLEAVGWALLAVVGELTAIRRALGKR
ncbi:MULTISPECIES: hypothetical protein [Protofrankia]|uniref:hypothetical protein n=1 Tax=Protofrankia TaxID=2994361 RepID=UPI000A78E8E6|nr:MULTISPECIES: hypothetical protein [Protofrankia]